MRFRLLLILLVAFVGLGADCGGSGSGSQSGSPSASFASSSTASGGEVGDDFVGPVPEPGAALVFGVGLLIAGAAIRRNR